MIIAKRRILIVESQPASRILSATIPLPPIQIQYRIYGTAATIPICKDFPLKFVYFEARKLIFQNFERKSEANIHDKVLRSFDQRKIISTNLSEMAANEYHPLLPYLESNFWNQFRKIVQISKFKFCLEILKLRSNQQRKFYDKHTKRTLTATFSQYNVPLVSKIIWYSN